MKKVITTLAIGLIAISVFAQGVQPIEKMELRKATPTTNPFFTTTTVEKHDTKGVSCSRWYDWSRAMYDQFETTRFKGGIHIYPDTNIMIQYATKTEGVYEYKVPYNHSVANAFDLRSDYLNDGDIAASNLGQMKYKKGNSYKLDSVGIYAYYQRFDSDKSIVDTLFIDVATNFNSVYSYFWSGSNAQYFGSDSVFYLGLPVASTNDYRLSTGHERFMILLDSNSVNDTIPASDPLWSGYGINYFSVNTNSLQLLSLPLVITSVNFKPGKIYTKLDTLNLNGNMFRALTFKENPDDGFISSYEKDIYNSSFILRTTEKYTAEPEYANVTNSLWGNPAQGFTFDHIWMDYKVSCANCEFVGINEAEESNNQIAVYPNPANSTVNIQLANNSAAQVELINLVGQTVLSQNASTGTVKLDVSNLNQGVYMVRVSQNNRVYTSKLIVK